MERKGNEKGKRKAKAKAKAKARERERESLKALKLVTKTLY
jgi:hypothetical protein